MTKPAIVLALGKVTAFGCHSLVTLSNSLLDPVRYRYVFPAIRVIVAASPLVAFFPCLRPLLLCTSIALVNGPTHPTKVKSCYYLESFWELSTTFDPVPFSKSKGT